MDILVDYLAFSSKIHSPSDILKWLGLEEVQFIEGRPIHGWTHCNYASGIRILYGGRDDIGVEMSGTGCRFLESCNELNWDWPKFFNEVQDHDKDMNISRLDIACDEKEGILNFEKMVKHTKQGRYISKAHNKRWIDGNEQSLIFGATTSDTRLRIYNKALERGVEGHWIRAEFQFRNEAADSFLFNLRHEKEIGTTYSGVLNNYLRFTRENPDDLNYHYEDAHVCAWWRKFAGTSRKIKNIRVGGMEYNLGNVLDYVQNQCSSSLKTLMMAYEGDFTKILDMIENAKLSKKQKMLLETIGE
jgi:DNA relaxase NicK